MGSGATIDKMQSTLLNHAEGMEISDRAPISWGDWEQVATEDMWKQIEMIVNTGSESGAVESTVINICKSGR